MDIDLRGHVVKEFDDETILFKDSETDKVARLPRDAIAIIQEVKGVTISLPFGLARAKGLA
jgi:hypothetical protein